jgi:methylmalonyl-CoA/ethylmalonyl-CoA epimerase
VKLGPLHHVAIAVPRIEDALPFFRDTLGFTAERIREIADQRVRVLFLGDKHQRIELIEPTDGESGVAKFVAEHPKPTLHHVCYVVDDLAGTLAQLQKDGVELVDRNPRRGAEGMVAFIHPRASGGVLIELIDRASLRDSIP